MCRRDTGVTHRVGVLDDDGAGTGGRHLQVRLPFDAVRRYVHSRGGLPDLVALELRCAYCAGVAAQPDADAAAAACAFCHDTKLWRLPWRGQASSDTNIQVSRELAHCTGIRDNTVVLLQIRDDLPRAEKVVLVPVGHVAGDLNNLCTSHHLANQIGIVDLNMIFPLWRNEDKLGEFKVIGTLPVTTGLFASSTRVHIKQGGKEKEIGAGLHHPIFHPVLLQIPETKKLACASLSEMTDQIVQKFVPYKDYLGQTCGKCTVILYGAYDKEVVARGVASVLRMRFETCSAIQLIKDYPDDSVAAIDEFFRSKTVRGPCVLFIDRFDEVVPDVGCGYTYITDVITVKLKLSLDEPMNCPHFIIAGARWRCLVEPGIHSRIRGVFFCGPDEEREGWDSVGICLRRLMAPRYSAEHKRWSTPNVVLYGCESVEDIVTSFAACRSLKVVRTEAPQLLLQYKQVGAVAISDLFLRATCERPALLFVDRFHTVAEHPMINEMCFHLDNLDSQVHVFVAVRWWQLLNPQLLQPGRLDKRVFCGAAGIQAPWDFVGDYLLQRQQSRGMIGCNMRTVPGADSRWRVKTEQ